MPRIAVAELPTTQPLPSTPPTTQSISQIQQWFDDLAHTEPAVRETARTALLGLSRDDLPSLRGVVQRSLPIAPAQAAVLHDIVVHVFLTDDPYDLIGGKGFLGVMLPEDTLGDEDAGIMIQECMPGFSAFRFLRPGDVIMALCTPDEYYLFRNRGDLIGAISSVPAGSAVTLRLLREGQWIEVTLRAGARPLVAEERDRSIDVVLAWRQKRYERGDEYWKEFFLPVLGPNVS